jgi:RNA polymerase sigma-54 factor
MLKTSLQLRMSQQLTMTPQLQQAIRLLQMPAIELQAHLGELLESNVMLEAEDDGEALTSFESLGADPQEFVRHDEGGAGADSSGDESAMGASVADDAAAEGADASVEIGDELWDDRTPGSGDSPRNADDDDRAEDYRDASGESLQDHLAWQLGLARLDPRDEAIGRALLDAINDDGYLTDPLDAIAATLAPEVVVDEADILAVLKVVQAFDPPGVGARSLSECLDLQLQQLDAATPGLALARQIVEAHLERVGARDNAGLRRVLGCDEEALLEALALVRHCHPKPGSQLGASRTEYVIPDVFVRRSPTGWLVEMNGATLPRIRINQGYVDMLGRGSGHAQLRAQLQEARFLLKSLEIRQDTLLKVARSIVERQVAFLEHGEEHMKPMILRDIAEAIAMHESTISRVTSGKYMHTPRGVFELRYFFSSQVESADGSGTSSTAIRAKIRKLVKEEPPEAPLSDSRLAEILSEEGIPVARRTVAKYREAMSIPPSNERKRAASRA